MPSMETARFDGLYCLFKGEPGTRKSTAALSFPGPIYYFDYDGKMDALRLPIKAWGLDPKTIEFDKYKDWDAARKKLEQFQLNCKYKTIVIDSITSLADASIRQTMKFKDSAGGGKKIGTIPVGGFDEYNAESAVLNEMIALSKDIQEYHKINFILIGHVIQKEIKGPNNTTHMARLLVTAGKSPAQKIPGYCSEIYHFNVESEMDTSKPPTYTLRTTHTGDDFARTSLPLPSAIAFRDDPLYDKWIRPAIDKLNVKVPPITPISGNVVPIK